MPNLPMHIHLANQVAGELDWVCLHDHVGSLFLGSTAPDIRAMTKWPRERTHFAHLAVEEVGTGTRAMFQRHPELSDPRTLSPATRAFVLGYISHLVADEVWITTVYRPYFGDRGMVTDSKPEAHIWDRALQLDMDRQSLAEMDGFRQAREAILCAEQDVNVGFIDSQALQEWGEWVRRFVGWDFTWERLRRALNRLYRDNDEVQRTVDRFLQDLPRSLDRVYDKIPREKLAAYRQKALDETVAQAREYMRGP